MVQEFKGQLLSVAVVAVQVSGLTAVQQAHDIWNADQQW